MPANATPTNISGRVAAAAIGQFMPIRSDGQPASAGDAIIGFTQASGAANSRVPVAVDGSSIAWAGGAISDGDLLQVGPGGTLIDWEGGAIVGRALNAAAVGDKVECLIFTQGGSERFNRPMLRVITMGDSITQYTTSSGWMLYVEMVSNGRVRLVKDAAVAGNTINQMIDRFAADVLPYASQADEIWVMAGTNDTAQADSSATHVSEISQLLSLARATGLRVRLFALPPRDNQITRALTYREIQSAVAIKMGVDFFDPWQSCIDPATGGFIAADTLDGVHPSASGHTKAGQAVVAHLNIPTSHAIALPVQNAANGGMLTNPLFVTDSNADGLADGLGVSGGGVPSLVASTFGNKQRLTATAQTNPTYIQLNPLLTVVPGRVYSVKGKLTVSGTGHMWGLRMRWQTSGSVDTNNLYPWQGQANASGEFEFRVTAPSDATKLAVHWSMQRQAAAANYTATMDMEQLQVVDLTAIGLG